MTYTPQGTNISNHLQNGLVRGSVGSQESNRHVVFQYSDILGSVTHSIMFKWTAPRHLQDEDMSFYLIGSNSQIVSTSSLKTAKLSPGIIFKTCKFSLKMAQTIWTKVRKSWRHQRHVLHWTSIAPQAIYIKSWFLETVWVAMSFVVWGSMFGVPMGLLSWFYPASEARKSTCQLVVIARLWFQPLSKDQIPRLNWNIFQLKLTQKQLPINALLGGGFKYFFYFHPYLGKWPNLTIIVSNELKPPSSLLLFGDKSRTPGVFYCQACFETTRWGFTCGCPRLSCSQCHFSPLHCSTAWGGDVALLNDMGPGKYAEDSQLYFCFWLSICFNLMFLCCVNIVDMLAANFEFTKFSSWRLMRCKGYFMFTKTPWGRKASRGTSTSCKKVVLTAGRGFCKTCHVQSHSLHGTGIFTYVYEKMHQSFM